MNLEQVLWQWNSEVLGDFVRLLGGKSGMHKGARLNYLRERMLNKASLREIWGRLNDLDRRIVSIAYHNGGVFNQLAFEAQYEKLPHGYGRLPGYSSSRLDSPLLHLFMSYNVISDDLMPLLEDLVLPLERFQLKGIEAPPAMVTFGRRSAHKVLGAETELSGQTDVLTYLQLVEQNGLQWSSAKEELTAGSIRKLTERLMDGDFPIDPEKVTAKTVIRPFGLDIFCRGAGWVVSGELTDSGQRYLRTREPELFLEGFERWTETGAYDELKRIAELRGVTSQQHYLTKPASRREKVIEALSWCPVGMWISLEDFFRAVKIWQLDFDVELSTYSELWAGPYKYDGQMSPDDYWDIVHGLYIKAVIMEYLATIGAVDIAYIWADISTVPGASNYIDASLSLHDGLLYLRINDWGAYLFGQAKGYAPQAPRGELFEIDDALNIKPVTDWRPNERLLLESVAKPDKSQGWRLSPFQILTAVENGQDFDYLARFLVENHRGQPSKTLTDLLARLERNLSVFREEKSQLVEIRISRPDARALVEEDVVLRTFCRPLDISTVVVPSTQLARVRTRLKELGYLVKER